MSRSPESESELAKIRSCLYLALQQTGVEITISEARQLASAFQEALNEDRMHIVWRSSIEREVAEMEPKP